jgi:hypothetical protein
MNLIISETLKITVDWDVTPCILVIGTNISEKDSNIQSEYITVLVGRCEVSQTVTMKITVFSGVTPCSLYIVTNISEEHTASILRSSTRLHGVAYDKTVIFVVSPVRISTRMGGWVTVLYRIGFLEQEATRHVQLFILQRSL